jgi:hypothetical protein
MMDANRIDQLARRMFTAAGSRRTLLTAAATLLGLLGAASPKADAAIRRKRKPKKRCPRQRRCGRRCCARSQECCKRACRAKCPPGARRNPLTCRCDPPCLTEGTTGDGPTCTTNSECCSGRCGASRQGFSTCRTAACTPPDGACTSNVQCCEGFCATLIGQAPKCTCAIGSEFCGGQCLPPCADGFIHDTATCECRCRAVDEACPNGGIGGLDESCCTGQCGCVTSDNCTCRKATCAVDGGLCLETSDCCRGTCVRVGALGRCER